MLSLLTWRRSSSRCRIRRTATISTSRGIGSTRGHYKERRRPLLEIDHPIAILLFATTTATIIDGRRHVIESMMSEMIMLLVMMMIMIGINERFVFFKVRYSVSDSWYHGTRVA